MATTSRRELLAAGIGLTLGSFGLRASESVRHSTRALPAGPGKIFGPGPSGWWDSERVSCPRVLRNRSGGWLMWYYGRDPDFNRQVTLPSGRVGLAKSDDGISWERVRGPLTNGAVFEPDIDATRFDSAHVGISDIHWRDGQYWMWYLGGDMAGKRAGFPLRPGCAVSSDGLNWSRVPGPYRGAASPFVLLLGSDPGHRQLKYAAAWKR